MKNIKLHQPDLLTSCNLRALSEIPAIVLKTYHGNKTIFVKDSIAPQEYPKAAPPNPAITPIAKPSSREIIKTPKVPHQYSDLETLVSKSFHLMK